MVANFDMPTDSSKQHPFLQKAKNSTLLAQLVDETMEAIAAAGGREAALGLDDEVSLVLKCLMLAHSCLRHCARRATANPKTTRAAKTQLGRTATMVRRTTAVQLLSVRKRFKQRGKSSLSRPLCKKPSNPQAR